MRKFKEDSLLIATSNQGKIDELKNFFIDYKINLLFIPDFSIKEPIEDGQTFEENSLIKAKYYSEKTGLVALADDSGISIDELNGEPGIYSARWAGKDGNFDQAIEMVETKLLSKGHNSSKAHFTCSLTLYWPDHHYEIFTGICEGNVKFPKMGNHGFGYDPIFIPENYNKTFSEIDISEKLPLSHRYKALMKLLSNCFE